MKEFSVHFVGAKRVRAEGEGKAQQVFNYYLSQPSTNNSQPIQRKNVPSYEAAVYRGVYQGIDLRVSQLSTINHQLAERVTGGRTGIKYEFIVAPGADWRQVRVRYDGIERLTLREDGTLVMHLGSANLAASSPHDEGVGRGSRRGALPFRSTDAPPLPRPLLHPMEERECLETCATTVAENWPPLVDAAPVIYQEVNGQRKEVAGKFVLVDGQTYGFAITGEYDARYGVHPVLELGQRWLRYDPQRQC